MQSKIKYIMDVGSSSIELMAVANIAGASRIITTESVLYDGFMDGEFLSVDLLKNCLTELQDKMISKMRKPITKIIVGVPSEFCVCICKRISRKFVGEHKIAVADVQDMYETNFSFGGSEQYELINYSPMQFVIDDNVKTLSPVGSKTSSIVLDASYILAKKSFIQTIKQNLNEIGICEVEFISTALGQAMNCEPRKADGKPIVVVDVGHITTSVCVYKGEGLALLSSFSVGGGHVSADIMQLLSLNFRDAELVKRKIILTIESLKNDYYEICSKGNLVKAPINITNQIVKSRIEMICKVIENILSVDDEYKAFDIYLTGNGIANFKGVKNILSNITNAKVYDYTIPFDNSKDKFKTSKTGLIKLADSAV